jgi:hypothetical protein
MGMWYDSGMIGFWRVGVREPVERWKSEKVKQGLTNISISLFLVSLFLSNQEKK